MKFNLVLPILSILITPSLGRFPFALEYDYQDFSHNEIITTKVNDGYKYMTEITNTGDYLINILSTNLNYFEEIDGEIYKRSLYETNYETPTYLAKDETVLLEFFSDSKLDIIGVDCSCLMTTKYETFDISTLSVEENNNEYHYSYTINDLGDNFKLDTNHTIITEILNNGMTYRFESYQNYQDREINFTSDVKLDLDNIKVTAIYAAEGLDQDYYDDQDTIFYGIIATVVVFAVIILGLVITSIVLPIITFKKKNKEN